MTPIAARRAPTRAGRRSRAGIWTAPGRIRYSVFLLAILLLLLPLPLVPLTPNPAHARPARAESTAEIALGAHHAERYPASLQSIAEKRFLRVATSRNGFDYFIDRGHSGGFQYEMVRAFTQYLNERHNKSVGSLPIQFELLPVRSEELIPMLLDGRVDLVAARLTITPERARQVLFSKPFRRVDELLVSREGVLLPHRLEELSGRRVSVRRSSSYFESLEQLNRNFSSHGRAPVRIEAVDEELATEDILSLLAAGRFDFTLADSLVAETAVRAFPRLRLVPGIALRRNGELAWATLPGAEALRVAIDAFLPRYRAGSLLGNIAARKYFGNAAALRAHLESRSDSNLSAYDAYFKRSGRHFGFDWRLLAAVAYQESRFDASARNRSGALGLFQIKPETAAEPYVAIPQIEGEEHARENVEAAAKYLAWIKRRYFDSLPGLRERDRLRMTLAAYNAGPSTLLRARERARQMGLDPDRYFRNVELALLAMHRSEPVRYVSEINRRYLSFVMLGIH